MLLKHEAVFQEPPHILWPPFSPTRHGREINKEQAVRGKMGGSGERELRVMENRREQLMWKIAIFTPHLQMFLFKGDTR